MLWISKPRERITKWTMNRRGQKSLHSLCVGCLRLALRSLGLGPFCSCLFQNLCLAQSPALALASCDEGDAWPRRMQTQHFQRVNIFGKPLPVALYSLFLGLLTDDLLHSTAEYSSTFRFTYFSFSKRRLCFVYGSEHTCTWMQRTASSSILRVPSPSLETGWVSC